MMLVGTRFGARVVGTGRFVTVPAAGRLQARISCITTPAKVIRDREESFFIALVPRYR